MHAYAHAWCKIWTQQCAECTAIPEKYPDQPARNRREVFLRYQQVNIRWSFFLGTL